MDGTPLEFRWGMERLPPRLIQAVPMLPLRFLEDQPGWFLDSHLSSWGIYAIQDRRGARTLTFRVGRSEAYTPVMDSSGSVVGERIDLHGQVRIIGGHCYVPAEVTLSWVGRDFTWEAKTLTLTLRGQPAT